MELNDCYRFLGLSESATDEDIKKTFKILAHRYHPDKNQERVDWATNEMSNLNKAYTTIIKHRFRGMGGNLGEKDIKPQKDEQRVQKTYRSRRTKEEDLGSAILNENLIKEFIKIRETAKEELYRYFQYGLYNLARRNRYLNRVIFEDIVLNLRKSYHALGNLSAKTRDIEFIKHFDTFRIMLFNFYMASECINIIDFFSDTIDSKAYRLFKRGDDTLHPSEREIFYDRHNRGLFKKGVAESLILKSEQYFKNVLKTFPNSTWVVETNIKLQYTLSLKEYIILFFSEAK